MVHGTTRNWAHRFRWAAPLLLALTLLSACTGTRTTEGAASSQQGPRSVETEPLRVVATWSILGDLLQNVGGDRIQLITLVPAGADAHTFEPSPADGVALIEASIVFENGLGFEPWLDDMLAASGSRARRVVVTEGIDVVHLEAGEHSDHAADTSSEADPHVWHDVGNAIHIVERIRDALVQADSANRAVYENNAGRYLQQLRELDSFVVAEVETLPPDRRKLVTSHDTFGYFARRYGFTVVDTALGISTEESEPSAAQMAALVEEIRAVGVPAIFAENVSNTRIMEQLAQAAGVRLAPELYTDALGEGGSPAATYVDMIRHNVSTIVTALRT